MTFLSEPNGAAPFGAPVFCVVCDQPIERRPGECRAEYKRKRVCSVECKIERTNFRAKSKASRKQQPDDGFVIAYVGDSVKPLRYVPRIFEIETEARAEMLVLLRGYPSTHQWRAMLCVDTWPMSRQAAPRMATAAELLAEVIGESEAA